MSIRAEVAGEVATLHGPFAFAFIKTINTLSGRKTWEGSSRVRVMASAGNIRLLKESDHEIEWIDKTGELKAQQELEALATQHSLPALPAIDYAPKNKLYAHQEKALALSWDRENYALFLEMGLGKSAILIANCGMLWAKGRLTGVLVISPKGVHRQWLETEVPKHLDPRVPVHSFIWNGKQINEPMNKSGLTFFSANTDIFRSATGNRQLRNFLAQHKGRSMIIVDESHNFKTASAERTKGLMATRELATFRRIATGTPIGKNIMDAWSQFNFLDTKILGHRYAASFRSRYCIMGGWEFKQVVGQKNSEEFYGLIAPHSFRLTKAEALDLPPKVYVAREYEMSEATMKHYKELKTSFMTQFEDGSIIDVTHAATALLRLQQIACGLIVTETGLQKISNERINETLEIIRQVEGPVVIWSRFTLNILELVELLEKEHGPGCAVSYYGDTSPTDRETAKQRFLSGEARFFVSNPQAGGTGLNLQGACRNVIYYSNDFNYISRQQSEDRTHRIGMSGAVTYFDLLARKSVDRAIIRNLRTKGDVSRLTFDQIRQAISDDAPLIDAPVQSFESEVATNDAAMANADEAWANWEKEMTS